MTKERERSVQITPEQLAQCDADWILVSPCGFDAVRAAADAQQLWQHEWWTSLKAVRSGQVYALDGNAYYARYEQSLSLMIIATPSRREFKERPLTVT